MLYEAVNTDYNVIAAPKATAEVGAISTWQLICSGQQAAQFIGTDTSKTTQTFP